MPFLNKPCVGLGTRGRDWLMSFAVVVAVFGHTSCSAPRPMLDPTGVSVIRTYQLNSTVMNPQPAWNPETYMIVARSLGGFGLLQEGQGRQEYFESRENRPTFYPVWINRDQFLFGPQHNVSSIADGRVVPSSPREMALASVGRKLPSSNPIAGPAKLREAGCSSAGVPVRSRKLLAVAKPAGHQTVAWCVRFCVATQGQRNGGQPEPM